MFLDSSLRSWYNFALVIIAQQIMKTKIKFKIGEFSKINQVTVKTLRHYEKIGLIAPCEVDEWTKYRYYDVSQLKKMSNIMYLKRLGFALSEIKDIMNKDGGIPSFGMIEAKIQLCKDEIKHFEVLQEELRELKNSLKKRTKMEKFIIKSLPAIIVASHRSVVHSYQDLFNLCPNVIGPEMERLGCVCSEPGYCYTIDHNKEHKETNIEIEYCEAVTEKKEDSELIQFKNIPAVKKALCFNHYGSYDKLPETWAKIYAFIEDNDYKIVDDPRFCYIDGIWNKNDESEWLTEIQVPIEK